jgi:hypothetical protein
MTRNTGSLDKFLIRVSPERSKPALTLLSTPNYHQHSPPITLANHQRKTPPPRLSFFKKPRSYIAIPQITGRRTDRKGQMPSLSPPGIYEKVRGELM